MLMKFVAVGLLAMSLGVAGAETGKDRKPAKRPTHAKPASAPKKAAKSDHEMKQTPFGPVEAKPAEPPPTMELSDDPMLKAEELGDLVIFRRKTPFGYQTWKKKKTELTADERKLLARDQEKPEESPEAPKAAAESAGKAAPDKL
jgi:type IV secretory pathway VirB10-like protein